MSAPTLSHPLPGLLRTGLARGGVELRQFFRDPVQVVFTFSMPTLLLILLGSVFSDQEGPVSASTLFAAGMIAAGVFSASFVTMGTGVAGDREDGTLKRLRATPTTAAAYFVGKVVLVTVTSLASTLIMVVVGVLFFDLALPDAVGNWVTLVWVVAMSIMCCSLLGIALSAVARTVNAAVAVMQVPFLVLSFISGVYFVPVTALPPLLLDIASVFPLRWMALGLRSVFLPEQAAVLETGGTYQLGTVALVLGAWCVAGLVLCLLTFRWTPRGGR